MTDSEEEVKLDQLYNGVIMKIKYSEIFFSFQGEAEYAGTPAVWLRFFGCNLNCNGFGQSDPTDPDTYILPYKDFDVSTVKDIKELPVWSYGCDSSYSWSSKYKHLVPFATASEIADRIVDQLRSEHNPEGLFTHPRTGQETMLCFTGGEPMLQQKAMKEVFLELISRRNAPILVTVETNGTRPLDEDFREFILRERFFGTKWHWAISPKLFSVSGEKDVVEPEVIGGYISIGSSSVLKFVCNGTPENWDELDASVENIRNEVTGPRMPDIWVMPVGATQEGQNNIGDLCVEAMQRGYKVATRNHVYVFGNCLGR